MKKTLRFETSAQLPKLLDELLLVPGLEPLDDPAAIGGKVASFLLEETDDGIAIHCRDDVDEDAVAAVVATHDPAPVATPAPPPAANAVFAALDALDPDSASVADVVHAVKAALAQAGAQPA